MPLLRWRPLTEHARRTQTHGPASGLMPLPSFRDIFQAWFSLSLFKTNYGEWGEIITRTYFLKTTGSHHEWQVCLESLELAGVGRRRPLFLMDYVLCPVLAQLGTWRCLEFPSFIKISASLHVPSSTFPAITDTAQTWNGPVFKGFLLWTIANMEKSGECVINYHVHISQL